MSNQIQAGTMMVQQSASMRSLGIESEPYSGSWRSLGVLESSGLGSQSSGCRMEFVFHGWRTEGSGTRLGRTEHSAREELSGYWLKLGCSILTVSK